MRTVLHTLLLLALLGGAVPAHAQQAGDAGRGASSYTLCAACHGLRGDGNQALGAPPIAGLPAWYTSAQLLAYRDGLRGAKLHDGKGQQMRVAAMQLAGDRALHDVAAYVADLPRTPSPTTLDPDTLEPAVGQALYTTCIGCHGPGGGGNPMLRAPPLAGQADWYLINELNKYRNGDRGYDPRDTAGKQMVAAMLPLKSRRAIRNVVGHINTLRPAPPMPTGTSP